MPLAGALVTVRQTGTTTPAPFTLYDAGGSVLANPLTADQRGVIDFYLDTDERVDLYATFPGYTPVTATVEVISQQTLTAPTVVGGLTVSSGGLAVSGAATFDAGLTIAGGATVNGGVSIPTGGLTVSGGAVAAFTGRLQVTANATGVAGSIYKDPTGGLTIWGVAGSLYDVVLLNGAGAGVLSVPTGTQNVNVAGTITVGTNGSTLAGTRITAGGLTVSVGNIGIGATAIAHAGVYITGPTLATNAAQYGIFVNPTVSNAATSSIAGVYVTMASAAAAAYTIPVSYGVYVASLTRGAGTTVTTSYGLYVATQSSSAPGHNTNVYIEDDFGGTPDRALYVAGRSEFAKAVICDASLFVATSVQLCASGAGQTLSFFGAGGTVKQTITGARSDPGTSGALQRLLVALEAYGLVTNSTTT